jgi:hypothetical protein
MSKKTNKILTKNIITAYFFLSAILGFVFGGCSNSSTNTKINDEVFGLYSIEGQKIITNENEETTVDTLYVEFLLMISKAEAGEDTIRLYGLQGVDTGDGDNRVYPNCTIPEECEVFAKLEGEDLKIDVINDGRSYQATGKIYQTYEPYIEMKATFNYQNTTIYYEVEGEK